MKSKEIREMSREELLTRVKQLRAETLNLRIQQRTGQLENPSRFLEVRRSVARVLTVLRQRENSN